MKIFEVTLGDGDVVKINGITFMKLKDKLMKVSLESGAPQVKDGVTSEEIVHPDGRRDCIIHVPCLGMSGRALEP